MHKIYFEKRCIIICSPDEQALSDPNAVEFHFGETINIHALVAMFEASRSLARIYIRQGRYRKALDIIERLSRKYPQKNAYFADQIRFLEKLIINSRSNSEIEN